MYFSGKEKRETNEKRACGIRDSCEKGAGMRDQEPRPPPLQTLQIVSLSRNMFTNRMVISRNVSNLRDVCNIMRLIQGKVSLISDCICHHTFIRRKGLHHLYVVTVKANHRMGTLRRAFAKLKNVYAMEWSLSGKLSQSCGIFIPSYSYYTLFER